MYYHSGAGTFFEPGGGQKI